ncbi:MAG TPA: hypothetical protein VGT40_18905 [Methylomirabilota bacterium]|jgi:hypothetical protein|nr:hypothetical protein [Methylomirabilota bacterium]
MLDRRQFTLIGNEGIGNPRSQVAQSMAYFQGRLYLGVTHPKGEGPMDAARVLRFDSKRMRWDTVYQSPLIEADENAIVHDIYRGESGAKLGRQRHQMVPRHRGFRCMTLFHPNAATAPWLFASTLSHWGSQLVRSQDGESLEEASEPGLGNRDVLSFRTIQGFRNMLFVSPVGTVKAGVMDRMFGDVARLYVSEDPVSGAWQEAIPPGFDDPTNRSVFCMTVFNGFLYAGTGNPDCGFDLWKTDADGTAPFTWKRVLTRGAWRYNLNEFVGSMAEFDGNLYVGTGIPGLGYDKAYDVGPAAAEIIRVAPDDSWELVTGTPRFTPAGLKAPTSHLGPGFGDPENSAMWSMAAWDGVLYVGTHNCSSFHTALRGEPSIYGGFQLWATRDGDHWQALTMDGFGDPFATGVRTLMPTPEGLYVGTSTHREVEKFWSRRTGMPSTPGAGGLSVWLGSKAASGRGASAR